MIRKFIYMMVGLLWSISLLAQTENVATEISAVTQQLNHLKPQGFFLEDSIEIGLPVHYILSLSHPAQMQLVFPDSSFKFSSFTLLEKQYFDTKTIDNQSVDSVVYKLTTFEIDKIQKLQLPIYVVFGKDCTAVYAQADSVFFRELVKGNVQNIQMKTTTQLQSLNDKFNYPYLITGVVLFLLVVFIIWGLLGKRILKAYHLFQFRTRHAIFIKDFSRLTNRITERKSEQDIEKAVSLWKKHLENIENQPFSSYTSKEIIQTIPDETLANSLKSIDRAVYGKEVSREIGNALNVLKNFSVFRFAKKLEQLRNV
jgi:hypothetical protein